LISLDVFCSGCCKALYTPHAIYSKILNNRKLNKQQQVKNYYISSINDYWSLITAVYAVNNAASGYSAGRIKQQSLRS
jgi:hypothetical protein